MKNVAVSALFLVALFTVSFGVPSVDHACLTSCNNNYNDCLDHCGVENASTPWNATVMCGHVLYPGTSNVPEYLHLINKKIDQPTDKTTASFR